MSSDPRPGQQAVSGPEQVGGGPPLVVGASVAAEGAVAIPEGGVVVVGGPAVDEEEEPAIVGWSSEVVAEEGVAVEERTPILEAEGVAAGEETPVVVWEVLSLVVGCGPSVVAGSHLAVSRVGQISDDVGTVVDAVVETAVEIAWSGRRGDHQVGSVQVWGGEGVCLLPGPQLHRYGPGTSGDNVQDRGMEAVCLLPGPHLHRCGPGTGGDGRSEEEALADS